MTIVVVGAGAAGLMASLYAARNGGRVLLLETTGDGGRKILISGGGRCNILPSRDEPGRFVTASSKHSLRNILRSWPLDQQRAFFEKELQQRLVLESETGKLFPASNRARDVRDGLVGSARTAGVTVRTNTRVVDVRPNRGGTGWSVTLGDKSTIEAERVVLATGGLSVPKTGSDGRGLVIAEKLGHTIHDTYPALTPLLSANHRHAHLAGVSLRATLRSPGKPSGFKTTGGFLFTHRGYSGPSVLDASHLYTRAVAQNEQIPKLLVEWTDRAPADLDTSLRSGAGTVLRSIAKLLPRRLADQLLSECEIDAGRQLSQLTRGERRVLVEAITAYPLRIAGDEGYRKAEVTGGGVALSEVHPRTLESRLHRGLFLCGEMLDAFGPIGGYNFQWAWATGRAAGLGAATSTPGDAIRA